MTLKFYYCKNGYSISLLPNILICFLRLLIENIGSFRDYFKNRMFRRIQKICKNY